MAVTKKLTSPEYDEAEIAGRLDILPSAARTVFACACAERLMAAFRWFCDLTGSASFEAVRAALDAARTLPTLGRAAGAGDVSALMPGDEEGCMPCTPVLSEAVSLGPVPPVQRATRV